MSASDTPFSLPNKVAVSTIYLDESGSRNSRGGFFVVGFVKVRKPAELDRQIRDLRQKHNFSNEIHFAEISRQDLSFYFDLVETLAAADVRVGGSVYDSQSSFSADVETWQRQSEMAAKLVVGNINRGELVNVFLDLVQTPRGKTAAAVVKDRVNQSLRSRCVLEAYDVDSKSTDLIQLADIVASSINYERKGSIGRNTPKAKVAERFRRALELDSFQDVRRGKVNILTFND